MTGVLSRVFSFQAVIFLHHAMYAFRETFTHLGAHDHFFVLVDDAEVSFALVFFALLTQLVPRKLTASVTRSKKSSALL